MTHSEGSLSERTMSPMNPQHISFIFTENFKKTDLVFFQNIVQSHVENLSVIIIHVAVNHCHGLYETYLIRIFPQMSNNKVFIENIANILMPN